jgi:hypothetical protein
MTSNEAFCSPARPETKPQPTVRPSGSFSVGASDIPNLVSYGSRATLRAQCYFNPMHLTILLSSTR